MLDESLKWFLKQKIGREFCIEKILEATPKEKNWQSFHTPYDLCEKMILKTDVKGKSILVLFNIEFVKVLIEKFGVHSNNITFLADCRLESEMATKTFHVNNKVVHNIEDIQEALKNMGKKFDLCFSNPPYGVKSQHTHLKILFQLLPICKQIIYVHPIGWLFKIKENIPNIYKTAKDKLKNRLIELEVFNPNSIFNIDQVDPCAISFIKESNDGKIFVNYFDQNLYEVDNINNITMFCENWLIYVKPFKETIQNYIKEFGELNSWNNRITYKDDLTTVDKTKYFCQFTSMQPGTGDKTGRYMHGEDLYKIINPNQLYNISYENIDNSRSKRLYYLNSEEELSNFINYLKTDFVRFCLAIYKTNQSLMGGNMSLIPVMDFTQEWTDEKLYEFFNIPQETIDYITNFFPDDIYGLRNNS